MNRIDYYRAVLLGVVVGISFITLFHLVFSAVDIPEPEETQPKSNFTVIEQYKGCDVVQWHYGMLAEYKYFLHCNNTRPVYEK
jgi:hypothetical protein